MLDGYKKRSLPRQPLCETLLVRRPKSVKTIDSTVRLHRTGTPAKDISIAFYLSSFLLLIPFCFSFYNPFLLCVSCCLLACVFDNVLFLGLLMNYCRLLCYLFKFFDRLCMNLLCLYVFSLVLINWSYFSNVTSTYYMEMK